MHYNVPSVNRHPSIQNARKQTLHALISLCLILMGLGTLKAEGYGSNRQARPEHARSGGGIWDFYQSISRPESGVRPASTADRLPRGKFARPAKRTFRIPLKPGTNIRAMTQGPTQPSVKPKKASATGNSSIRRKAYRARKTYKPRRRKTIRRTVRRKNSRRKASVSGFPTTLQPTPKKGYRYRAPDFYQGIYLTNMTIRRKRRYISLLNKAKALGVNTLVVDVQPVMASANFIRTAREMGFYMVARVVVFQGGLKRYPPSLRHIHRVLDVSESAARKGFMEVQLDYIRFADPRGKRRFMRLSLKKRYRLIEGILKMATDRIRPLGVRVGADIFGRIAFNKDDIIGQKVELFAAHLDTIYPMLYPSHFYGDPKMIRDPYKAIYKGTLNCIRRSRGKSRIIAYIQGFKMKIGPSRLGYVRYIQKQIQASEDAGSAGYIVWNARNRYRSFFRALKMHKRMRQAGKLNRPRRRSGRGASG